MLLSQFAICVVFLRIILCVQSNVQMGPDPWHNGANINKNVPQERLPEVTVPPDLMPVQHIKKPLQQTNNACDWFYKRMLAIFLKGGKVDERDEFVEISTNFKFTKEQWNMLNEYMKSSSVLNQDIYRKSIAFVEGGICKPTMTDKAISFWNNYIQHYFTIYKMEIFYALVVIIFLVSTYSLWSILTARQIKILAIAIIYMYEVFISFKEAEKQEYELFVSAVKGCNWFKMNCDVPAPDILLFLKHMHPLKIAMRLLTSIISEPIVLISSTVNVIIAGLTDGLWFPLNKIVSGCFLVCVNLTYIMLLTMLLFNFILNVPFKLSFFAGLISFGVTQRKRTIIEPEPPTVIQSNDDRISGSNLNHLLAIIANNCKKKESPLSSPVAGNRMPLKKSSSAGRLTDLTSDSRAIDFKAHIRNVKHSNKKSFWLGGGDSKR